MMQVNMRGTFVCSQACLPFLKKGNNPHILMLSPPLDMNPRWFGPHVAYTMAKYGMSMCVLGMAEDFKPHKIAVNALWPKTTISTAAVQNLLGGDGMIQKSRKPDIVADAASQILNLPSDSNENTGNFFIDEDIIKKYVGSDLKHYQMDPELPENELMPDLFL